MGLIIIFSLVTLLSVYGLFRSVIEKNVLAIIFAFGTVAVFGWFTVMTILKHGYPTAH
ncbi:DUF2759 domain-containing protein [Bacillus carboniphilus]|uniref:DUF2759 domain-containing protein n=1 Tax=Bacillus carboniphilus TaxID=86663 RepID=A0ABY9JWY7_9BACI|nr:DUF2759 domain-containing protein [Bacillus carboniphilus]WLR43927.1 DUF2759 domain-containing protein [Bacillus carboniphilus]